MTKEDFLAAVREETKAMQDAMSRADEAERAKNAALYDVDESRKKIRALSDEYETAYREANLANADPNLVAKCREHAKKLDECWRRHSIFGVSQVLPDEEVASRYRAFILFMQVNRMRLRYVDDIVIHNLAFKHEDEPELKQEFFIDDYIPVISRDHKTQIYVASEERAALGMTDIDIVRPWFDSISGRHHYKGLGKMVVFPETKH